MEMITVCYLVENCFQESLNRSLVNGKNPTHLLLGTLEFDVWQKMEDHMPSLAHAQVAFYGLNVRRMKHPGVAVLSG